MGDLYQEHHIRAFGLYAPVSIHIVFYFYIKALQEPAPILYNYYYSFLTDLQKMCTLHALKNVYSSFVFQSNKYVFFCKNMTYEQEDLFRGRFAVWQCV